MKNKIKKTGIAVIALMLFALTGLSATSFDQGIKKSFLYGRVYDTGLCR